MRPSRWGFPDEAGALNLTAALILPFALHAVHVLLLSQGFIAFLVEAEVQFVAVAVGVGFVFLWRALGAKVVFAARITARFTRHSTYSTACAKQSCTASGS